MGRELKRVPLDFEWPLNTVWRGFVNPLHVAKKCASCDGTGYSHTAKNLRDQWYGYAPFKPGDRGSVPFAPDDEAVRARAARNVERSPSFYGHGKYAITREAERLCQHWNGSWSYHLNADDICALIAADRLYDFTHIWKSGEGWKMKAPSSMPTPREVNEWSIGGMGHDSLNQWVCLKAECKRIGVPHLCTHCDGSGETWPSPEERHAYEIWEPTPPPSGSGFQIWETVSEGSPISPVFSSAAELAAHMATTKWGGDQGTPMETWLAFIEGPGWAPSMVMQNGELQSGVEAVVSTGND